MQKQNPFFGGKGGKGGGVLTLGDPASDLEV